MTMENKLHSAQTQTDGEYMICSNITRHSLQFLHIIGNHIRLRVSAILHRINCGSAQCNDYTGIIASRNYSEGEFHMIAEYMIDVSSMTTNEIEVC